MISKPFCWSPRFIEMMLQTLFVLRILLIITLARAQTNTTITTGCKDTCGRVPVHYPFGTGSGCGDPLFQRYVQCLDNKLTLITRHGSYRITSIDYSNRAVLIADDLMSTCWAMQNSGSFQLDSESPFRLHNDVFILLGCSSSSPLFDPRLPLCDTGSSHLCAALYSCPSLSALGISESATSTCCVYSPLSLGPSNSLDLPRLQCSSYSSVYSFNGHPTEPMKWRYGIALKYAVHVGGENENEYLSSACNVCQQSGGICGYTPGALPTAEAESFVCVCKNGVNTTTSCYGQGFVWSAASRVSVPARLMMLLSMAGAGMMIRR